MTSTPISLHNSHCLGSSTVVPDKTAARVSPGTRAVSGTPLDAVALSPTRSENDRLASEEKIKPGDERPLDLFSSAVGPLYRDCQ